MPKSKSQRMRPVNRLADKQEQQSAIIFSQCQARVQELEQQLEKLYQYRDGYNQQMLEKSQQGMGSYRLQDTLMFMNNLNQSIETLLNQIQKQKELCIEKREAWMTMHNKKRIYNKVTEKYLHEEQKQKNKQEQKSLDEHNQNLYHRKNTKL